MSPLAFRDYGEDVPSCLAAPLPGHGWHRSCSALCAESSRGIDVPGKPRALALLLYLGEITDSQQAAWTKLIAVFHAAADLTAELALYPADRGVPEHAIEYGVQGILKAANAANSSSFPVRGAAAVGRKGGGDQRPSSATLPQATPFPPQPGRRRVTSRRAGRHSSPSKWLLII